MIILRLPFEHYKGASRLSFILWLIYPHHWDMILLEDSIQCSVYFKTSSLWLVGMWTLSSSMWARELFSLRLSDAFFDIYVEFHSLHATSTQPDWRRPLCRFLELSLSLSVQFLPLQYFAQQIIVSLASLNLDLCILNSAWPLGFFGFPFLLHSLEAASGQRARAIVGLTWFVFLLPGL